MACFRLFTFFPLLPDFSFPRLNSCISRFTSLPALGLYLRRELDLRPRDDLRRELELRLRDVERCLVAINSSCLLIWNSPGIEIREVRAKVGAKLSGCSREGHDRRNQRPQRSKMQVSVAFVLTQAIFALVSHSGGHENHRYFGSSLRLRRTRRDAVRVDAFALRQVRLGIFRALGRKGIVL